MKNCILILSIVISISACSQSTFSEIQECIVEPKVFPQLTNPKAIRITPLFVTSSAGVYSFVETGPHRFNQLVIRETGKCNVFPKDSSSSYVRLEIKKFIKRNKLNSKAKRKLKKDIEEYIISFKEGRL